MSKQRQPDSSRSPSCSFTLILFVVGLCLLSPVTKAQNQEDVTLFPIIEGDKVGYIDKSGKIIIPPQFDKGFFNEGNLKDLQFSEGLAAVNVRGKWGYIDKTGTTVIKPQYVSAWPFAEGLAEVRVADGRSAYIDKEGKIVVSALSALGSNPFSDGLAGVYIGDSSKGRWGFIDKTGTMVIELRFDAAGPFSEGLASVRIDDQWGFIDREGKFAIPLQNKLIYGSQFYEGFAQVWKLDGKGDLIDKSGSVLCDFKYRGISPFSEGLAVVDVNIEGEVPLGAALDPTKAQWGRRAAGYLDKTGQIAIQPRFDLAGPFSDGLAVVGIGTPKNTKAGYIDKTGAIIIPLEFDIAFNFHNGLALVATGERPNLRWGYIDKSGSYVWLAKAPRSEWRLGFTNRSAQEALSAAPA